MRRASIYVVKGLQYYDGPDRIRRGILKAGDRVQLVRERGNPYDPFAVAVYAGRNSSKIGHISRDHSKSVATSIDAGEVEATSIHSVELGSALRVYLCITFCDARPPTPSPRQTDRLTASASSLPQAAGVYRIENTATGSIYVGSAACLHERALDHLCDLRAGRHVNHLLQQDYSRYGPEAFRFVLVVTTASGAAAELREKEEIESAARQGELLYNRTIDGKGRREAISSAQTGYVDIAGKLADQARRSAGSLSTDPAPAPVQGIPREIVIDSPSLLSRLVGAILRYFGY